MSGPAAIPPGAVHAVAEAECVFCKIISGEYQAINGAVREWPDALAIVPLGPVTDGHVIVMPKRHVADIAEDPIISAAVIARVAELAAAGPCNVITSRGREATQSVFHLHVHIVPRCESDGLALPWTGQVKRDLAAPDHYLGGATEAEDYRDEKWEDATS